MVGMFCTMADIKRKEERMSDTTKIQFRTNVNYDNGITSQSMGEMNNEMEMFFENGVPTEIEWVVEDDLFVEHIGLTFERKVLVDFDGVFELPKEAIQMIRAAGFTVPKEFEED
jgi:hypothetical protein